MEIPIEDRKPLDEYSCCYCLSGNCKRSHDKKWSNSECSLFQQFGITQARKISASIPTTNIMEKCPLCGESVYKYLMKKHFTKTHPMKPVPDIFIVNQQELKKGYELFKKQQTQKVRKPKHGSTYKLLIPYDGTQTQQNQTQHETKQKVSEKYGIKISGSKRKNIDE
eukprot:962210_1